MTVSSYTNNSSSKHVTSSDVPDLIVNTSENLKLITIVQAGSKFNIGADTIKKWIKKSPDIALKIKAQQRGRGVTAPWYVDEYSFAVYMQEYRKSDKPLVSSLPASQQDDKLIKSYENHIVSLKTELEERNKQLNDLLRQQEQINEILRQQENFNKISESFQTLLLLQKKDVIEMPSSRGFIIPKYESTDEEAKTSENAKKLLKTKKWWKIW